MIKDPVSKGKSTHAIRQELDMRRILFESGFSKASKLPPQAVKVCHVRATQIKSKVRVVSAVL